MNWPKAVVMDAYCVDGVMQPSLSLGYEMDILAKYFPQTA